MPYAKKGMKPNALTTQRHSGSQMLYHLGALLTVTLWGTSFVSTALLLNHNMGPVEIYIYRFTLAYILLLLIDHRKFLANSINDEIVFLLCGITSGSIYFIAENSALEYTQASNVSLITSLAPLLTALFIGLLYKSERPSAGTWIGSIVAFIGVGCIIIKDDGAGQDSFSGMTGDLLALAAAVSWAFYSILLRRINASYSTTFITRKTLFYGVLTSIPFLGIEKSLTPFSTLLETEVWLNILLLGIGSSLIGFFLWGMAVKRLGAITASNYLYFSPVVTLICAWIVLNERIEPMGYVGCALVIGGLVLGDYLSKYMRRPTIRR